ncbi:hypothetical protein AVEN_118345-1 [Araneus ventricosus]|uniref:Uncharacterized protein n=1 Tax=Araneus ventricosus TaxID=182803 RepID=A0A4Y2B5B3_ARAVE|nr:hypothetical protein AVEN_118345-1 [Araneus ventricosus]
MSANKSCYGGLKFPIALQLYGSPRMFLLVLVMNRWDPPKLTFKDHKRKISRDFPDNEVARSFLATCQVLTIYSLARLRACHSCIFVYVPAYQR